MLVRWRKLLQSSSSRIIPPSISFRNARSAPRHYCQLRLYPKIVDSTVSNCASDVLALSFFLWAARQPVYFHAAASFDRIVPAVLRLTLRFGLAGLPSEALRLYYLMIIEGVIPDSYSYVGLLSSLCKLGRTEHAVHVYYGILMSNSHVDAYVHSAILDGLVKNRKYHSAIKLFREVVSKKLCIDVVSYTIAVHALSKGGRFEEACDLFEHMKHFGPVPNIYTYNVMISGHRRRRDLDGTKKLLKEMMDTGINMDHISVNAVAHLLIKLGRCDSALFMLKNMHESRKLYLQGCT